MARNNDLNQKRNAEIKAMYDDLYFKKMLREDVIFPQLAKKFYLAESTIYRIILSFTKETVAA